MSLPVEKQIIEQCRKVRAISTGEFTFCNTLLFRGAICAVPIDDPRETVFDAAMPLPVKKAEKRAVQGRRGFCEGAYSNVRNRSINASLTVYCKICKLIS